MGRPAESSLGLPAEGQSRRVTVPELVACLKRIRLSIDRWNRTVGRQGYLEYASQFII